VKKDRKSYAYACFSDLWRMQLQIGLIKDSFEEELWMLAIFSRGAKMSETKILSPLSIFLAPVKSIRQKVN